jgi:EmrB/QacA subfamily drug resistance transporter
MLFLAAAGVFFAADDQTFVVAVLPKMIPDLGLFQDEFYRAAWIVNGYILGYIVAMPLMGRIADTYGHGRVFAAALAVFMLGSAWVALSTDLTTVTLARTFQAVGGGAVVPVAMALVADTVPPSRRAFGFGAMAAASEAGALLGPLWGGGLGDLIGWRGLFWLNIPISMPIAVAVLALSRGQQGRRQMIDYFGTGLLGGSLVCLTIGLTDDPIAPRATALTLVLFAGAAVLFAFFILRQLRTPAPVVDLLLFRRVPLTAGFVTNGLVGGGLIVAMVSVPLFTNVVLGDSALQGGLNLMRLLVALPVGALLGGALANRLGLNFTAGLGVVLAGVGFLGMARWDADPGQVALTLPLFVAGLGMGLVIAPINTAVLGEVPEGQRATVSALLTVMRLLGALVGVALLTTRGLGGFYAEAGLIPLDDPRFTELVEGLTVESFAESFRVTALVCFAAVVPALLLGRRPERETSPKYPVI